jgi:recA bacterial DNA recombination protein
MSSFPLFSSLSASRPFFMPQPAMSAISAKALLTASLPHVVPASRLEVRPMPELVSSGIRALDSLTGGFPRASLTEVCGEASSGRTSLLLALLASATQRHEACALVDVSDAFDPLSAAAAGVNFERLLWVRCEQNSYSPRRHRTTEKTNRQMGSPVEQALRVSDLVLQSGGFGLVAIDLADVPFKIARRIPLTTWFRLQRAVEHTPTVLCVITPKPCAQSCAALLLSMQAESLMKKPSAFSSQQSVKNNDIVKAHGCSHAEPARQKAQASAPEIPWHSQLLEGFNVRSEVLRSRRKPSQSESATFITKTRFA